MIVYVETNFVLELVFLQEEHESCNVILDLAEAQQIDLVLPAFCVVEPYETWVRRDKQRRELYAKLKSEIRELSRSKPYTEESQKLQELSRLFLKSGEEEKFRLDQALMQIVGSANIVPIEAQTIASAIAFQSQYNLSPQDSIVYSSVLTHLNSQANKSSCFITRNAKDFSNPDIEAELAAHQCKLLTTFRDGLGYIRSVL